MTDWAGRYRDQDTPWDLGRAHPELLRRLVAGELAPFDGGRALVAGCGRGYDALALAEAGWQVTAVDLVPLETPSLRKLEELGGCFEVRDALAFRAEESFDLVFDHTFFCAIQPQERASFGEMVRSVTGPGSVVVSLVFPFDKPLEDGGPPFGFQAADLQEALGASFRSEVDELVIEGVSRRTWKERWSRWVRDDA